MKQQVFFNIDFCAEVLVEGVKFDLGGIGKGYAAEKVSEILKEWSLEQSLVLAGASSVLCVSVPDGMNGWPVRLRNPDDSREILIRFDLKEGAISGSGRKKGQHIIDPRSIEAVRRVWEVEGVNEVVNEIQIGNRNSLKEYAQDVWITTQVRGLAAKTVGLRSLR